jgi:fatty-acyl-CoA synthase
MDRGFGSWVTRRASQDGARTVLVDSDTRRRVTADELDRRTNAIANGLYDAGVRRGDRVAMLLPNSAEYIEAVVGVAKLGAVSVPLNTRLSAREIAHCLRDAGCRLLFLADEHAATADAAMGERDLALQTVVRVPSTAGRTRTTASEFEQLVRSGSPTARDEDVTHDDLAFLLYTSGTTGRAKGAMVTHGNVHWACLMYLTHGVGLTPQSRSLSATPLFHVGGLMVFALPVLYVGGTVVTQGSFEPRRTLELIAEEQVTIQFLVPAMWAELARLPDFDDHDLSNLQECLTGGAPCPLPVIEFYLDRGLCFLEAYGLTETTGPGCVLESPFVRQHSGSVGRPYMHVDAMVADDDGRPLPVGEIGEMLFRGPNVFAGYWGLPGATLEAFHGDWFRTGDLARIDEHGFYTIVDRKKDMVITGGENVYPVEVEQVLVRHPAVREVAVIGAPDERWGERVVAVIVLEPEQTIDERELRAWCRERIAHYKAPRELRVVDELPRNPSGKVLKRALRLEITGSETSVNR